MEPVRWAFGHADVGGLNEDFHLLISSARFDGGFRERFFFSRWRIGYEAERFSPWSPYAIVLLRKDSPGAVPFDNEESARQSASLGATSAHVPTWPQTVEISISSVVPELAD